jgi:hypothetical protein
MPNSRSLRLVRFVWLFRAVALRRCVRAIFVTVLSITLLGVRSPFNHQERTNAANALCSWHTVSSGFFPQPFLPHPRQEQVTHRRQD